MIGVALIVSAVIVVAGQNWLWFKREFPSIDAPEWLVYLYAVIPVVLFVLGAGLV